MDIYITNYRGANMRYVCRMALVVAGISLLFIPVVYAQDENPNGFPSGPHYNMNIIGKKGGFTCPQVENDPITGLPIYGNVVFVPDDGNGIQIMMQSGATKGKRASAITELQAIDPCAVFDEDAAVVQLPPNANGYRVYARALAKPGADTSMTIIPSLVAAYDEWGDPLVYLGLVTSNGVFVASDETLYRTGKKSTAMPITNLFMWSGTVCTPSNTLTQLCVKDTSDPPDGVADEAVAPVSVGVCPDTTYTLIEIPAYCREYTNPTWVFNIADWVEYLWSVDNTGTKLVNVRFYPN